MSERVLVVVLKAALQRITSTLFGSVPGYPPTMIRQCGGCADAPIAVPWRGKPRRSSVCCSDREREREPLVVVVQAIRPRSYGNVEDAPRIACNTPHRLSAHDHHHGLEHTDEGQSDRRAWRTTKARAGE
jgi:hypothetical protein